MDQYAHGPDLRQRLPDDFSVNENITANDPDRFPRQADNPLDISLAGLSREVNTATSQPLGRRKSYRNFYQHAVAALGRRRVIRAALAAIRADRSAGLTFLVNPYHEQEIAVRARDFAMQPQERGGHRSGRNDISLRRERTHQQHAQAK